MNSVFMIGKISSEILKFNVQQFDKNVISFSLMVEDRTRETDGKKNLHFFDCEAWDKVADRVYDYCKKGSKVGISGHLEQKKWQTKDGKTKQKVVIVLSTCEFLDPLQPKTDENGEVSEEIEDDTLPF